MAKIVNEKRIDLRIGVIKEEGVEVRIDCEAEYVVRAEDLSESRSQRIVLSQQQEAQLLAIAKAALTQIKDIEE